MRTPTKGTPHLTKQPCLRLLVASLFYASGFSDAQTSTSQTDRCLELVKTHTVDDIDPA